MNVNRHFNPPQKAKGKRFFAMFDILIKNSLIIDGTGQKGRRLDVAVQNGRIVAVDRDIEAQAGEILDGQGKVLAPGFIDIHCHTDTYHIAHPDSEIKLRQGVCMDVVGNCGESVAPLSPETAVTLPYQNDFIRLCPTARSFGDFAACVKQVRPALRVMSHAGHGAIRVQTMGHSAARPNPEQLSAMKNDLAVAMEQGAVGFSTGLYYSPSGFAREEELVELAKVAARYKGFHASHIRNEALGLIDSLKEIIAVGLKSGVDTHISHFKAAGKTNWSFADPAVAEIEKARSRGLDITCDVYPYDRSSTTILALIPPWAQEGGISRLTARLLDPQKRLRIIGEMKDGLPGWENSYHNAGFEGIMISSVRTSANKGLAGKTISQASENAGKDPFEFACDLILAEQGEVSIIVSSMNEKIVAEFLALPFAMVSSDGDPGADMPHPRAFGTFPRVFRRFVRELKALTMEQAVAKMTGMPAKRLGLEKYGLIRKDYTADLVLFDPKEFADTATFEKPRSFPIGLAAVVVNGQMAIRNSRLTEIRSGGFVYGPAGG